MANIPDELRALPQWVIWREEVRDGKKTKVPYQPQHPERGAKADDPKTWSTFEMAMTAAAHASGIGFEFSTNDPYCGVDIDDCRDPRTGRLNETAASWVDRFATYTEISPTGTGLHMIGRGHVPGKRNRTGVWELYDHGRYFTVTGETLNWTTISDVQDELDKLYMYLWPESNGKNPTAQAAATLDDRELLERMFSAKNGEAIRALYDGRWEHLYSSQSEADYALCLHLAFWTQREAQQMDRIFRSSGLMRDKWTSSRPEYGTYGWDTIYKAIGQTRDVYEPRHLTVVAPPLVEASAEVATLEVFPGLSHGEVLELEFPPERMLIEDLVPIGAVGTIAGVPETFKSWQAQRIAIAVASGEGGIFGREVAHSGPVGYFWQDDSTREEAERIQLYDRVCGGGPELAVRWHLNEGLRLPDDMERLRITIEHFGYVLVVLDSFYNVLFGMDLKDEEAERVISLLKSEVCDTTNCTVLIVDHMPWATQENRKRLRAYGGVFKGAAVRFGIYLDAVGNKLYVEARGNNITGFKRQPAEWDAEALELHLIGTKPAVQDEEYEDRVRAFLAEHPEGVETSRVDSETGGDTSQIGKARLRLLAANRVSSFRKPGDRRTYWKLSTGADPSGFQAQENLLNLDEPGSGFSGLPRRGANPETQLEPSAVDIPF